MALLGSAPLFRTRLVHRPWYSVPIGTGDRHRLVDLRKGKERLDYIHVPVPRDTPNVSWKLEDQKQEGLPFFTLLPPCVLFFYVKQSVARYFTIASTASLDGTLVCIFESEFL